LGSVASSPDSPRKGDEAPLRLTHYRLPGRRVTPPTENVACPDPPAPSERGAWKGDARIRVEMANPITNGRRKTALATENPDGVTIEEKGTRTGCARTHPLEPEGVASCHVGK
jgi:hypothetical protein